MVKGRRRALAAEMDASDVVLEENRQTLANVDRITADTKALRASIRSRSAYYDAKFQQAIHEEKKGVRIVDMDDASETTQVQPPENI
jgi:type II secretory pathway component PulM